MGGTIAEEKRTMTQTVPTPIYDVAAVETWLEDLSREGWHLSGFQRGKGIFEAGAPSGCRYRLQPLMRKKEQMDPERKELYQSMGWSYVGILSKVFHVWRCEDPSAPELDTDPLVQGESYRYLQYQMSLGLGVTALLLVLLVAVHVCFRGETPLLDAVQYGVPGHGILLVLACVLGAIVIVTDLRAMRRLMRSLRAGIPLKRPRPYQRGLWLARASILICWVVIFLPIIGRGHTISGNSLESGWDAEVSETGVPANAVYLDLRELDSVGVDVEYFRTRTKIHELAPRMYQVRQFVELPQGTFLWTESIYYRMLTKGLAEELTRELIVSRPGSFGNAPRKEMERVPASRLDAFFWRSDERGGQYVVAAMGCRVLDAAYQGPTDLRAAEAVFVRLLED